MKILFFSALCLALSSCGSKTITRFSETPDSVLVQAFIDVPAQIEVGLKLPLASLESYRVGQRLFVQPDITDPERFGNIYVVDAKGVYPIIIKSLTPRYGF
ncbi:hypothetical protein [Spirosoma oryzicola]|uniref:hypothetical protein n=1 Tax=Spirosoma oryzicola TaxID=2898794 RepID=UPI001E582234|nr:hypothetical protein [Spirosoma oryzicola]UHG93461.1 hypothetical protein LQ777_11265 [Spirosoma oryzicola]